MQKENDDFNKYAEELQNRGGGCYVDRVCHG